MTEDLCASTASSDHTARPDEYVLQPLQPVEVNVDTSTGPTMTADEAYEIFKRVRRGYPNDLPRDPTSIPYVTSDGAQIMYTKTPHDYHDKLSLTEAGYDEGTCDNIDVLFLDGSAMGERQFIQTTGEGEDFTAKKITCFNAIVPNGFGCEYNFANGIRPIKSNLDHASNTSGACSRPVSYDHVPVRMKKKDLLHRLRPPGSTSFTHEYRPNGSMACGSSPSGKHSVVFTRQNESTGEDDQQRYVHCRLDSDPQGGESSSADEEKDEECNTTGFFWKDSWAYNPEAISPQKTGTTHASRPVSRAKLAQLWPPTVP